MKFFATIAALAVAAVASAQSPTFTNCAAGTTDMAVSGFSLNPYPLCIGASVCATVSGTLNNPIISGAGLSVVGKFFGKIVYSDSQDLCAVLAASGNPCPVPVTVTSVTACITVKSSAPANIPVVLTLSASNGNNHVLFCQSATVTAQTCSS